MTLEWNEAIATHLLLVDDDEDEVLGHVISVVMQWTPSCRRELYVATTANGGIEYKDDAWTNTPEIIGEFLTVEAAKKAVEHYVEAEG